MLRVEARTPARRLSPSSGRERADALRSRARRERARRPCCGSPRAWCGRTAVACVCGDDVWLDTERDIDVPPERRRCGYLFQEFALFPHLSAARQRRLSAAGAAQIGTAASAPSSCSSASASRSSPTAGRARSRAASSSEWRWRVRWPGGRRPCCSTSRCRRSTLAPAHARRASCPQVLREVEVPTLLVTHDFFEAAQLGDSRRGDRPRPRDPGGNGIGARRAAALGVRRRLHRGGGADGNRPPGRERPDGGRARRWRHGREHGRAAGPGRRQRLSVGDRDRAGRRGARRLGPQPPRRRGDFDDGRRQPGARGALRRDRSSSPRSLRRRPSASRCASALASPRAGRPPPPALSRFD